ncbi:MAG: hypothetical protein CMA63_01640 [Euryarchaeota archaeon]|nr:hypothetical protein [Euryarchaeota archaeon]|tara:strand:+ start:54558 stop:57110 length:2553 start_codon:yes stop_codon:yes gene_type:complete
MSDSDDSSEPGSVMEPMAAHRDPWKQHQLLSNVLDRYFFIGANVGGGVWPTWIVSPRHDTEIDDCLENANAYLSKLGWAAKLVQAEEWIVQIFPLPERQFPSLRFTILMWFFSALCLTLAGDYWLKGSRPSGGWFASSGFLDALIGYTLPVLLCLFIASSIQKRTAKHFNHRVGHITPLPEPSIAFWSIGLFSQASLVWPFGLFLIPTLPRMDARPWSDRKVLGWVAVTVPATLISLGMALWAIGLWLTPEYVAVTSSQNVVQGPFLVEVLGQWQMNEYITRLTWAHPFAKAGALLTFFGWISLLPIPTFPGGRIMVARTGPSEARSGSNQIFLFLIILAFAWMFDAFNGFTIWLFILALILPLLLFFGTDRRTPIILNESKGLDLQSIKNIGLVMLIAVLFALPSQVPFEIDEDWDARVFYDVNHNVTAELVDGVWNAQVTLLVTNPSSINRDWAADFDQYDDDLSGWSLIWDCDDEDQLGINGFGCGSTLPPRTQTSVYLNMTWTMNQVSPMMANFSLLTHDHGEYLTHLISVRPELDLYPASPWVLQVDEGEMKRCMKVQAKSASSLNVSFPQAVAVQDLQSRLYWIEGFSGLNASYEESPSRICLRGLDPVLLRSSELNTITLNNVSFDAGQPEIPLVAVVPERGWNITADAKLGWGFKLESGGILSTLEDACPLDSTLGIPPTSSVGQWVWDLDVRNIYKIPAVTNINNSWHIQMSDDDELKVCSENLSPLPEFEFVVERGPELVFNRYNTSHRLWSNQWMAAYDGVLLHEQGAQFEFYNSDNASIPVQLNFVGNGLEQWSIVASPNSLQTGWNTFEFTPSSSTYSTLWFEHQDGTLVIHLASYV